MLALFAVLISAIIAAPVQQWDCVNQAGAYWEAYTAGGGYVYVVNRNSGKCLEIQSSATHNGAPAQQYRCEALPTMNWALPF
ncbi:RICIN domain-containing protein [Lentzea alba]|uniref:RICIN domain-containing protein n=1 Tax=Lentzea alba TaxID=2714351 RepID=UPI0039BF1039